jgi:hypothetical protein
MREWEWVNFYSAALKVARAFGINRALAEKRLRQACAEELIRSMIVPWDEDSQGQPLQLPYEFWTRVSPDEWRSRAVDYDSGTYVMLHETEFRDWLSGQDKPKAQSRGQPRRQPAKEAIDALYPNGIDPGVKNMDIVYEVGQWLRDRSRPVPSNETILRAAGRRK